jgi:hypothetical protein
MSSTIRALIQIDMNGATTSSITTLEIIALSAK